MLTEYAAGGGARSQGLHADAPGPSDSIEALVMAHLLRVYPRSYEVLAIVTALWPRADRAARPGLKTKVRLGSVVAARAAAPTAGSSATCQPCRAFDMPVPCCRVVRQNHDVLALKDAAY